MHVDSVASGGCLTVVSRGGRVESAETLRVAVVQGSVAQDVSFSRRADRSAADRRRRDDRSWIATEHL
eukprot:3617776-Rhodomonas_salina.5